MDFRRFSLSKRVFLDSIEELGSDTDVDLKNPPSSPLRTGKGIKNFRSLEHQIKLNKEARALQTKQNGFSRTRSRSDMEATSKIKRNYDCFEDDIPGLNAEGKGVQLALSFLHAQDNTLLKSAGEYVGRLLEDVGGSSLYEDISDSDFSININNDTVCTSQELKAISILAMSRNASLRQVSGNIIRNIASRDGFARGRLPMAEILNRATEMVSSGTLSLKVFAIRTAISVASKGPIWCERIVQKGWLESMIATIIDITQEGEWIVERSKSEEAFDSASSTCSSYGSSTEDQEGKISDRCRTPPLTREYSFEFGAHKRNSRPRGKRSSYSRSFMYEDENLTYSSDNIMLEAQHNEARRGIYISAEQKLVLKLALKLVGTLNLVQMERDLKKRSKPTDMVREKRMELIELLSHMCEGCHSKKDTSLLLLLCGALNSLISDMSQSEWTDSLSDLFVEKTLATLLDRAQEATSEIHEIAAVVSRTIPTDYASVEKEEEDEDFNNGTKGESDVKTSQMIKKSVHLTSLACEALKVIRSACESRLVAEATAECFEEFSVMRILTVLSRSQSYGTKTEIATFLYAVCANISDKHKLLLCDSGIIVRLLRLASPSTVYGAYDSPRGHADESAFTPAIRAIIEMAKVDIIGSRIILAGGLCPLYSHANSSRSTRVAGREALETLGVTDINDVVGFWTNNRKQREKEIEEELKQESKTTVAKISKRPTLARAVSCNGIPLGRQASVESFKPRSIRIKSALSSVKRSDGSPVLISEDSLSPPLQGESLWDKSLILGSGSFSTVYRSLLRSSVLQKAEASKTDDDEEVDEWTNVAVKKLTDAAVADESFLNEIKILSKLPRHQNIAQLHGVIFSNDTVHLVSELAGRNTLAHHLATIAYDNPSKLCSSWRSRVQVLLGIAEALKCLQSMSPAILHLDLKSSNILITETSSGEYVAKLCDFGLAVELKAGHEFLSPANHGTLQWMAPEVMHDEEFELSRGFSETADVFSFAILMWEVAHPGRVPWDELKIESDCGSIQDRIRDIVCSGRRLKCENVHSWPVGYETLMRKCWRQRPSERPCFIRSFLADPDSLTRSDSIPAVLKNMLTHQLQKKTQTSQRRRRNSRPAVVMRSQSDGQNYPPNPEMWKPDKNRLLRTYSQRDWNLKPVDRANLIDRLELKR